MTLTTYEAAMMLVKDENANWTYNGAEALVEFIEEVDGEDVELDIVALRCEFSQYDSLLDFAEEYGADLSEAPECEVERDTEIRDYINENGILIEFDGGIIVSSF